ncbi:MAG: HAD family hydrolase [Verrucomicrobiales bacterium]
MADSSSIEFPKPGYAALIFDLDGTLVNSMPAHFEAWCRALEEHGAPGVFPEDVFYAMGGRPTRDIVKVLNGEQGLHLDPDAVSYAKRKNFLRVLDQVTEIEEVCDFARANRGKVPMAVVSGGTRQIVEKTLQTLGLSDLFDEVVAAEDVENGKPAPDPFLKASTLLNVDPADCVVFEDAPAGIMGAQLAGMQVVSVPAPLLVAS